VPASARVLALRLLSRRDYTTAELRTKLRSREYPHDEIEEALRRLTADGLLDDRRAAVTHVRQSGAKGRGRHRIERELASRGIDRATAREIAAAMPAGDETASIERFLARKRLSLPLSAADRRRVFQQLLRRGFPAETIARALRSPAPDEES
jgi:regulatory protein